MIGILGTRRLMILAVLAGINLLLAAVAYLYFLPDLTSKESQFRSLRGQITGMQSDIDRMLIEFDQLEVQQAQFEALQRDGFFSDQNRLQAEKVFGYIQEESGVISAVASVKGAQVVENEETDKADHRVLESPVTIKIEALDDVDVFRYIYLVETFFPGHVTIQSLKLERALEVSGTVLRSIASHKNPVLVTADIELTWRTVIPKDKVLDFEEGTL